ncbi:MAG: outer membrane beta-barrel protein [Planctomycetota bacterium]
MRIFRAKRLLLTLAALASSAAHGQELAENLFDLSFGEFHGPALLDAPEVQAPVDETKSTEPNDPSEPDSAISEGIQQVAYLAEDAAPSLETKVTSATFENSSVCRCPSCSHPFQASRRRGFLFGGWLQQGFTFNPSDPDNNSNAPVLFNDRANDYQLNQLYFYIGKDVDPNASSWDIGGRFDLNYGTESRFVTVPGLERHDDRTRRWNSESSDYGLAIPQAFVELGTPLGPHGSSFQLGHFFALSGYETFTAPDNFFYSRANSFLYGQPFTHTGGVWNGKITSDSAVSLGVTTGWDAFYDETDSWGIRYAFLKEFGRGQTTFSMTGHVGDENTGIQDADGARKDTRNWVSLLVRHYLNKRLYYVLQGDYGRQDGAVLVLDSLSNTIGFDDASWFSLNQYWVYQLNSQWSSGLRVEWFHDDGNSRMGLPITYSNGGDAFDGGNYFAITGGLNFKPRDNVILRSEFRWDFSDVESNPDIPAVVAGVRPFNDRSDDNQITMAVDAILTF